MLVCTWKDEGCQNFWKFVMELRENIWIMWNGMSVTRRDSFIQVICAFVSPSHVEGFKCDERMLSNIRRQPSNLHVRNVSPSPFRTFFPTLFLHEWLRRIVTNFHFFHRDPCHRFQFEKWDFFSRLPSRLETIFFKLEGCEFFGVY